MPDSYQSISPLAGIVENADVIKSILASLSIFFAIFVWYMAFHAGARENQDWAPIGAVLYGLIGGTLLLAVGVGSTIHLLGTKKAIPGADESPSDTSALMLLFINAGWVLTALAVLKVLILN
jgi:hypothetical protein